MTLDLSEYKNSIYHNPQRYDDQYWWKKNDIEFWKNIYNQSKGKKVLELGCGTGRLAIPLISAELIILELKFLEFCDYAEKKIISNGLKPNIINEDFRFLILMISMILFYRIQYIFTFIDRFDALQCLESVRKHA